jgi:hypothetical protein
MTVPESPLTGTTPAAPVPGRSAWPLVLVLLLWAVVLAQWALGGDTAIEEREARVAAIEADWRTRLAEVDDEDVLKLAREKIEAYRALATRSWGDRSWRIRYRAAKPQAPLAPPGDFRAVLDRARAVIVLTWKPPPGADVVVVRGRRGQQEGAWTHPLAGTSSRWEDELFELSGTYTYELLSQRENETSRPSASQVVTFSFEPEMKLLGADLGRQTATIRIGLADIGHRTGRFLPRTFLVRVGETVGTQAEGGVDYDTGYRLARLVDRPDRVYVTEDARAFTPEGKIARGPDGKPLMRKATFRRQVWKVIARLESKSGDRAVLTLEAPR